MLTEAARSRKGAITEPLTFSGTKGNIRRQRNETQPSSRETCPNCRCLRYKNGSGDDATARMSAERWQRERFAAEPPRSVTLWALWGSYFQSQSPPGHTSFRFFLFSPPPLSVSTIAIEVVLCRVAPTGRLEETVEDTVSKKKGTNLFFNEATVVS